jgi:hypothetical protein
MPPPIPVSMPMSAAMIGLSPKASAFCAPDTAKSASPAPSNTSTGFRSRSMAVGHQKVIIPAKTETARYRQSLIAAGGTAPISRSRVIPPKLPTTNDNTSTPKMSSRRLTPNLAGAVGLHRRLCIWGAGAPECCRRGAVYDQYMSTKPVTFEDHRYREDLAQLAAAQYQIADRLCGVCRNFHAFWPYRRIARVVGAARPKLVGAALEALLAEVFADGRRRVLIAGAADTGLLAITARAGLGRDIEIVVVDRCRTPLELCRQFAKRWSLNAEMLHQDLTSLDVAASFDVVFANSVLRFIAPEQRIDFLSRLRGALRRDRRLVKSSTRADVLPAKLWLITAQAIPAG